MTFPFSPTELPSGLDPYTSTFYDNIFNVHKAIPTESAFIFPTDVAEFDAYRSSFPPERLGIYAGAEKRPADLAGLMNKDQDLPKDVYLVVYTDDNNTRGRHWALRWVITHTLARTMEITTALSGERYINWGPVTNASALQTSGQTIGICLGEFELARRRQLEAIAWHVPIVPPDGKWNCQNWIVAVLGIAVARTIMPREVVLNSIRKATQNVLQGDPSPWTPRVESTKNVV